MRYYPVNLDIAGRPCLVVGGGAVAERKVTTLLAAGAFVLVVSPTVTAGLAELARQRRIRHDARPYQTGDAAGFRLVLAATDDPAINRQVAADAHFVGALVNVADEPRECDFTLPALVVRDELVLAVSTSGRSPALAHYVRQELEKIIGPEYGEYLTLLAEMRQAAKEQLATPEARRELWQQELATVLALLKEGRRREAKERIQHAIDGFRTQS